MSVPISGMTGFARCEGAMAGWLWVWEARSVNGRTLDLKVRLPQGQDSLDPLIRDGAKARFSRGSFQVSLSLKRDTGDEAPELQVNQVLVDQLLAAGAARVASGQVRAPDWAGLLAVRGVVTIADDVVAEDAREALDAALRQGLDTVLDQLKAARVAEGAALATVFARLFDEVETALAAATIAASGQVAALQTKVARRAAELLGSTLVDEQRLAQEVAMLAMKADVQEELDRVSAHLADGRALLAAGGAIGRKLDFLAQELHREANTLTTKSATLDLTRIGIELKTTIDRLKEQAANAE
ncbi:MAG: YicC family protein [Hyphomonadaceae bacterium]|jgi:uncharacterized protein (TIGR00255 family)|nr:YicC family protein [Hyphomonadaceae bacterium]